MNKYKYIFVVLVYRNGEDLEDFFTSIEDRCNDYHVLVVNSYYNDESEEEIKNIAMEHNASFISVENKGYSYGNNQGIAYAKYNYDFDYLIVCNPDIILKTWNVDNICQEDLVVGPVIRTSTGKNQNPCFVRYLPFTEKLMYFSYKYNIPKLDYIHFGLNRLIRDIWLRWFFMTKKVEANVYGVHGSFIIFTRLYLNREERPFCDEMFLFNEERYVAWRLKKIDSEPIFTSQIEIYHKEDGSMKRASIDMVSQEKSSFLKYYKKKTSI